MFYKCFGFLFLTISHIINFQLCFKFLYPTILPLLFFTSELKLVKSINKSLTELNINDEIDLNKIQDMKLEKIKITGSFYFMLSKKYNILNFSNFILNLLMSFSLQLITLFLLEIIKVTDFSIRHLDWYITVSTLTISFTFLIPSYILYYWIFKYELSVNSKPNTLFQKLSKYGIALVLWSLVISIILMLLLKFNIEGNILQLSLYLLSLIGVSCLSVLNGIGCTMGVYDAWSWYSGGDINDTEQKELEISCELKTLDNLFYQINENNPCTNDLKLLLWDKLNNIDSLLRSLACEKQKKDKLNFIINISFWIYSIYKVVYALFGILELLIFAILFNKSNITQNNSFYDGNGDFLSQNIAKCILIVYNRENISFYSTWDDYFLSNEYLLDQITMLVNFFISLVFFVFSFQNVLLTFKNFKILSQNLIHITKFEIFNKIREDLKDLLDLKTGTYFSNQKEKMAVHDFQELIYLCLCQITGIYVISTALLLNSANIPIHLKSLFLSSNDWMQEISSKDSMNVNAEFINNWFDNWFFLGCSSTVMMMIVVKYFRTLYLNMSYNTFDEEKLIV